MIRPKDKEAQQSDDRTLTATKKGDVRMLCGCVLPACARSRDRAWC